MQHKPIHGYLSIRCSDLVYNLHIIKVVFNPGFQLKWNTKLCSSYK